MIKIIIIFILLVIIFLLYNYECENMNNYNSFLDSKTSLFIHKRIYDKYELLEITKLPICYKNLNANLSSNSNNIINDEKSISHTMTDLLVNTVEINSLNYNLIKLEWKRSRFLYNNNPVGLQLHIMLNSFKDINNVFIVIPLDLKNTTIESFVNLFYYKNLNEEINGYKNDDNYINLKKTNIINENDVQYVNIADVDTRIINENYFNGNNTYANIKNSFPDINDNGDIFKNIENDHNKYNLNLEYGILDNNLDNLLTNVNQIPTYQCCKVSIGPIVNFKLCNLEKLLNNTTKFYKLFEESGAILYITDPIPYNEQIGLYIRNVIIDDDINYIVPPS